MKKSNKGWQIISIASGKGGVGKTLSTVNIATSIARDQGASKEVVILDGDLGLANVDVVLGLHARYNINDVLEGSCSMSDIILQGPLGVKVIPASSGMTKMKTTSLMQKVGVLELMNASSLVPGYLVIDSGAGINEDVLYLNSLASEVIVVTTPEPHAITDAYAFIKMMNQNYRTDKFNLIINMVRSKDEGTKVFEKLSEVADRFLGVQLIHLGNIPLDPNVRRSVMQRQVITDSTLLSLSGQAWKNCAMTLMASGVAESPSEDIWKSVVFQKNYETFAGRI